MNIKTTLFLIAVLVGIGVYFLVFEKDRAGLVDAVDERPLFTAEEMSPNGVKTVQIKWENGSAELTRENEQWMQTQPVRFPLNTMRVSGILNDTARLQYVERFVPGADGKPTLADCKLDNPRVTIRFIGEARDTQIRADGNPDTKTTPFDRTVGIGGGLTGSRGYVALSDDPHVYVVTNTLHNILLNENVSLWRQTSLEVPGEAQADRIKMVVEDRTIEFRKTGADWYFAPPLNDRIAPKAPAALLGLVKGASVGRFISEDPKNLAMFGLDKPAIEVTVQTSAIEPRTRTLRIGNAADPSNQTYYATWSLGEAPSPVVFTVMGDARGRFVAPRTDELRDPRITLAKTAALREVMIRTAERGELRLQKSPTAGWAFAAEEGKPPAPFKPDQEAVGQLLDAVINAKAKYYHPRATQPAEPLATIEFSVNIGKDQERLVLSKPPAEAIPRGDQTPMIMVIRNSETTGYLVPEASLRPVFEPVIRLRDRQIVDVKPEQFEHVVLKRFDGVTYEFKRFTTAVSPSAKPQWQMVGADAEGFEKDGLDQLLKHSSTLRASSWLEEPKPFGQRTVELSLTTVGAQTRVITIDLETRQGKVAGVDGVFAASDETKLYFDAEYRPRTVLDLRPGEVAQVTITKGQNKPFTIGKDEFGRYNQLDNSVGGKPITTAQLKTDSAAKMFDALTPLRVWRHVPKPTDAAVLGDAEATIEVVTRTAKKHTILIGFKGEPTLATLNDKWFTLTPATLAALTAETIKKDEAAK